MIKNCFFAIIVLVCFLSYNGYNTSSREKTLVCANDTLWCCDMNNSFCHKMKIDDYFSIIFDGDVCKIGEFEKYTVNDTIHTVFNSCVSFEAKSKKAYGIKMRDDLDSFIKELEKCKIALNRLSRISKENNVDNHIEVFATGDAPIFGLGSTYHKEGNVEYISVNGIGTGNEHYHSAYSVIGGVYSNLNIKSEVKFYNQKQLDEWIKILKKFSKNKFVKISDLYK